MAKPVGQHVTSSGEVFIFDSGVFRTISRADYEAKGYGPAVDDLPSQDEYIAAQQKASNARLDEERKKTPQERSS